MCPHVFLHENIDETYGEAVPVQKQDNENLPHVCSVILTWNDVEMTARCVESLLGTSYAETSIVVVDNGSTIPGCPILKERFPSIETVQLDRNYGFTGGCNRGMLRALEMNADYVFLLNNDTIVHADAIGHLVEAMEQNLDVAMASAVLLFPGEEKRIQFIQGELIRDVARHVHPGEDEILDDRHRETFTTEFAPACAVLFRPKALKEVGMFDESLFTNWEDYDLCCRFQDAGWKILSVGRAEVVHAHGQTTGKISPFITYFFTRNRLICLFRYASLSTIIRRSPFILRTFYWHVRGYGFTNWPAHMAFLKGIAHFLFGVRGDHAPRNTKDNKRKG